MSEAKYISVIVKGNPDGNSGVNDIVIYNNPQFNIEFNTHGGLKDSQYYFSLKIEKNYTVYKLINPKVRSNGAFREGYLAIAFSIPRGYELMATNPYQVLMELWKTFKEKCMTLKDPVSGVFEYNSKHIDPTVLDETAQTFLLRPVNRAFRSMTANGEVALILKPEDKIEELLKDVHYPEFVVYSEILLAESTSNASNYVRLDNIQIPRPIAYTLIVDGKKEGTVTDRKKQIPITSNKDKNYYVNKTVTFCIEDLKENRFPGVDLDEDNEQIIVSTNSWAEQKVETYKIQFIPAEAEEYFKCKKSLIKIVTPKSEIQLDDNFCFTLTGPDIAYAIQNQILLTTDRKSHWEVSHNGVSHTGNQYKIKMQKKQTTTTGSQKTDAKVLPSCIEVKLLLSKNFYNKLVEESGKKVKVKCSLEHREGEREHIQTTDVIFRPSEDRKSFVGSIYLSNEWKNQHIGLSFKIGKDLYTSCLKNLSQNDQNIFESKDFEKTSAAISKNSQRIAVIILALLLGLLLGYGVRFAQEKWFHGNEEPTTETTEANGKDESETSRGDDLTGTNSNSDSKNATESDKMSKEAANEYFEKVKETLKKKDVTFQEIKMLHSQWKDEYAPFDEGNKIFNKIETYNNLVLSIEMGNIDEAKNTAAQPYVSKSHADKVRELNDNNYKGVNSFAGIVPSREDSATSSEQNNKKDKKGQKDIYKCNNNKDGDPKCTFSTKDPNELKNHLKSGKHTIQQPIR